MAVRNPHIESIVPFNGLNTLQPQANVPPNSWVESLNVVVTAAGTARSMFSPLTWGGTNVSYTEIGSAFSWPRQAGSLVLIDDIAHSGAPVTYGVQTSTGAVSTIYTGLSSDLNLRYKRLYINDKAYGINGAHFTQIEPGSYNSYAVGITAPAAAPTLAFATGGSLTLLVGVTVSYAYYNSVTGHVGQCSPPSLASGPTTSANKTLGINVVASTQLGVTGIVLFITADSGAIRYLITTSNGTPFINPNQTAQIQLSLPYLLDYNTTETLFNARPPDTAFFMFRHQDRIFLLNFQTAAQHPNIVYSGLEAVGVGIPTEAYPPLNFIVIPARGEQAIGGISTPAGALIFSDRETYLLSGEIIDIVLSAQNVLQASYNLTPLGWGIGTRSPYTAMATPFGVIWLDQNKRIQLWPYTGLPTEIGLPLRNALSQIQDTTAARFMAEATWFQYGLQQFYVLCASTSGSYNNQMFIVGVYEEAQPQTNAYQTMAHPVRVTTAVSDIAGQSIITHIDQNGTAHALIAPSPGYNPSNSSIPLMDILNWSAPGNGWTTTTSSLRPYFGVVSGSFPGNTNWSTLHSAHYEASAADLTLQVRNFDDSEYDTANPERLPNEGGTYYALINRYGVHKRVRFTFPGDDSKIRELYNLRLQYSGKTRP